jgi:hypothetical protein
MLVLAVGWSGVNVLGEKAQMHPAAGLPEGPALAGRSDLATDSTGLAREAARKLRGRRLLAARAACLAVIVLTLGLAIPGFVLVFQRPELLDQPELQALVDKLGISMRVVMAVGLVVPMAAVSAVASFLFWLFCRICGSAQARPGSGGHRPPRASMASPMSASGEWNPNAIRVSSRSLVLTDSTRPLDRPWSRVAWMPARWSVTERASLTNAGIRQRRAHTSQASTARPRGRL